MFKKTDNLFIAKMVQGIIFLIDRGAENEKDEAESYLRFLINRIEKRQLTEASNVVSLQSREKF